MTQHAKLSASGAHRWANCAASVKAEKEYHAQSSPHAELGSTAHELAELCLTQGLNPYDFVGKYLIEHNIYEVDDEMAQGVQLYIDYVKSESRSKKASMLIENRVDFSEWVPGGFGTADCIIVDETTIKVIDLKYGKGKQVFAENNLQGALYALGAYADYNALFDLQRVKIVIVQPRLDHIDEWEISTGELLEIGEWLANRADEALSENPTYSPSIDACQWCKAKPRCTALKKLTEETLLADFDHIEDTLDSIDKLTDEQIGLVLKHEKLIKSFLDAAKSYAYEVLETGSEFPGYKLVSGRNAKKWKDDEETIKQDLITLLNVDESDVTETKLISPAKAEKLAGKNKKLISDLYNVEPGAPVMVSESDKRKKIDSILDNFDHLSNT